jgi:hypothetical protein
MDVSSKSGSTARGRNTAPKGILEADAMAAVDGKCPVVHRHRCDGMTTL